MLNLKESIQPESPQYTSNEQRENYEQNKDHTTWSLTQISWSRNKNICFKWQAS